MPRFFFHLWDTKAFVPGPNGTELPDLIAVRQKAKLNAQEILADGRRRGEDRGHWTLEVRNEADQTVLTAPVSQAAVSADQPHPS
jgi:hypothetical protein